MGQEDRLKKQIDQLGKILAKLLNDLTGSRAFRTTDISTSTFEETLEAELGITWNDFTSIHGSELIELLVSKQIKKDNMELLAEVLLVLGHREESEKKNLFHRQSLALLEHLEQTDKNYSIPRNFKIRNLRRSL